MRGRSISPARWKFGPSSSVAIPRGAQIVDARGKFVIPGLTDHEMPSIIAAAVDSGARFAGHVTLRLPYAVAPLFEQWLAKHLPLKQEKVLNRIRSLRNGKLYDSQFGSRMRGEGIFADHGQAVAPEMRQQVGAIQMLRQRHPEMMARRARGKADALEETRGELLACGGHVVSTHLAKRVADERPHHFLPPHQLEVRVVHRLGNVTRRCRRGRDRLVGQRLSLEE